MVGITQLLVGWFTREFGFKIPNKRKEGLGHFFFVFREFKPGAKGLGKRFGWGFFSQYSHIKFGVNFCNWVGWGTKGTFYFGGDFTLFGKGKVSHNLYFYPGPKGRKRLSKGKGLFNTFLCLEERNNKGVFWGGIRHSLG